MPEGRVQYCGHETPDLVWLPEWIRHPNSAEALTDFLIVAADPAEAAHRFATFAGRRFREEDGGLFAIGLDRGRITRSEEHTSELQSLMRISYAVFCLKKKKTSPTHNTNQI